MTRRERDLSGSPGARLDRRAHPEFALAPAAPAIGAVVIASFSPGDAGNQRVIEGCLCRAVRDRTPLEDGAGDERSNKRRSREVTSNVISFPVRGQHRIKAIASRLRQLDLTDYDAPQEMRVMRACRGMYPDCSVEAVQAYLDATDEPAQSA